MASIRTLPPAWLLLWIAAASWAIFQHGPLPLYSTRTLGVAWEMWNHAEFLVPQINGAPYSHKVPLLFWLIHAGWAVFGVSDVWPRVLQVLMGAAWLCVSAALARRVVEGRPSTAAIVPWLLIALGYPFLFGLQIMYEVLLALCVASALFALTGRPRWGWFALAIGAGLLTKGPVILLHIVFPWLLGPWWSAAARSDRRAWYTRGLVAMVVGIGVLFAWAIPAGIAGGDSYRNELYFLQTAGRVVSSFDHARPIYWYLPLLLVLWFPWIGWPRLWHAVASVRGPLTDSERFAISWIVPTFVVFCLISGKQLYYLLPLLPGMALLLASAIGRQQSRVLGTGRRWRAWPLAGGLLLFALGLVTLPFWPATNAGAAHWTSDLAHAAPWFAIGFAGLGGLVLFGRPTRELHRIAVAGLLAIALAHTVFAGTLYHHFDLRPTAELLARAEADGRPIANLGRYEAQFHFLGRLNGRIAEIEEADVAAWAATHADGLIVRYSVNDASSTPSGALLVQPFRSRTIEVWDALSYARARSDVDTPPLP